MHKLLLQKEAILVLCEIATLLKKGKRGRQSTAENGQTLGHRSSVVMVRMVWILIPAHSSCQKAFSTACNFSQKLFFFNSISKKSNCNQSNIWQQNKVLYLLKLLCANFIIG